MMHGISLVHLDELGGAGRLGRHVEHDSRSLLYQVDPTGVPVVTTLWPRNTPILDQGNVGSCTGNAATGALGCEPFSTPNGIGTLDEKFAVELYHEATVVDGYPGTYPPDDTGSSGLAVAKACKADGFISGYTHATSLEAALAALMAGPVITGVNWYEGFDSPDTDGFVKVAGAVRGGHEFVVRGVDVENQRIHADNSWGPSWGKGGSFSFSFDDWGRLLDEQGDVTVFVPLTQPAPTPTPVPTPTPGPTPNGDDLAVVLEHIAELPFHYVGHRSLAVIKAWLADRGN